MRAFADAWPWIRIARYVDEPVFSKNSNLELQEVRRAVRVAALVFEDFEEIYTCTAAVPSFELVYPGPTVGIIRVDIKANIRSE